MFSRHRSCLINHQVIIAPELIKSVQKRRSVNGDRNEDQQASVKVQRYEAEKISKIRDHEPSDEVESSEPRSMEEQLLKDAKIVQEQQKVAENSHQKTTAVQQKISACPPPEDTRDPVMDGNKKQQQTTDEISIPETPTTEEQEKHTENAQPKDVEIKENQGNVENVDDFDIDCDDAPKVFNLVTFISKILNFLYVFIHEGLCQRCKRFLERYSKHQRNLRFAGWRRNQFL
jgi:hypothetical protein